MSRNSLFLPIRVNNTLILPITYTKNPGFTLDHLLFSLLDTQSLSPSCWFWSHTTAQSPILLPALRPRHLAAIISPTHPATSSSLPASTSISLPVRSPGSHLSSFPNVSTRSCHLSTETCSKASHHTWNKILAHSHRPGEPAAPDTAWFPSPSPPSPSSSMCFSSRPHLTDLASPLPPPVFTFTALSARNVLV